MSDESADEAERLAAVSLLRHSAARDAGDRERLAGLLRPRVPVAVQQAWRRRLQATPGAGENDRAPTA